MKVVLQYDPTKGHPAGKNLFYECLRCKNEVPSLPIDGVARCTCGNIKIDIGRMSIGSQADVQLIKRRKGIWPFWSK